ncbi:hypothetical protein BKA64DRAFT_72689 [Cadophora sp. MPI-SDFR-AT-0126]|nr:hypothetical protein BKA64DRAFT_72689 [Leotiomycetes sp. MPI-SDFR-AT-0126]
MSDAQPSAAHANTGSDITHLGPVVVHTSSPTSTQADTNSCAPGQATKELHTRETFSTFTKFPNLPTELRLKVWEFACCVTRNLVLQIQDMTQGFSEYTPYYFWTSCPVPAVLGVCQESRVKALQHYSLDFGARETWELDRGQMTFEAPATIYINWAFDRVCMFHVGDFVEFTHVGGQISKRLSALQQRFSHNKLRYLACELTTHGELDMLFGYHHTDLMAFPGYDNHLEDVILFQRYGTLDYYSYSTHGWLEFTSVLEDEKERFEDPVEVLCREMRRDFLEKRNTEIPPMPFDIRCAMVLLYKRKDKGQEVQAAKIEEKDKRNGTAIVMKGEIWKGRPDTD